MLFLLILLLMPEQAVAAPESSVAYHIVAPAHALQPGQSVELKIEPALPPGSRVYWYSEPSHRGLFGNVYRAPYDIPAGTKPIQVMAVVFHPSGDFTITTEVQLSPGQVPGARDCLGPGQQWGFEFQYVDGLPEPTRRVAPMVPPGHERREDHSVVIRTLVCKNGNVLDAFYVPAYSSPGGEQIDVDRKFAEAAVEAVKKWVFKPGTLNGQPMATWVDIPFRPSE